MFQVSRPRRRVRAGFTLIELLVVVAIIALLISILLPSLARAREQAKAVQCASRMRALNQAIYYYTSDNKDTLPNFSPLYTWGMRDFFWTSQILSYVTLDPKIFACPSDRTPVVRYVEGSDIGLREDNNQGAGGRGGGRGGGLGLTSTGVALAQSYHGTCDHLSGQSWPRGPSQQDPNPGVIHGLLPRRLTDYQYPSRDVVILEAGKWRIENDTFSCFRWSLLTGGGGYRPDDLSLTRHYGGDNPINNGSNFAFLDLHVSWHSSHELQTRLACAQRTRDEVNTCEQFYPYPVTGQHN